MNFKRSFYEVLLAILSVSILGALVFVPFLIISWPGMHSASEAFSYILLVQFMLGFVITVFGIVWLMLKIRKMRSDS
ncbi:hypothetical protein IWQ51_006828 [Labrenzia sp. EL_142]|nr:hypothetical protein [Labrenzia sp. EL_142]